MLSSSSTSNKERQGSKKGGWLAVRSTELTTKVLYGQYMRLLKQSEYDTVVSKKWLQSWTESMICVIQEQAITTLHIQRIIHKTATNDQCRLCRRAVVTIHHIISECTVMVPTKYLWRHDNVCKYVHDLLLLEFGFKQVSTPWYQHQPPTNEESNNVKILWMETFKLTTRSNTTSQK